MLSQLRNQLQKWADKHRDAVFLIECFVALAFILGVVFWDQPAQDAARAANIAAWSATQTVVAAQPTATPVPTRTTAQQAEEKERLRDAIHSGSQVFLDWFFVSLVVFGVVGMICTACRK